MNYDIRICRREDRAFPEKFRMLKGMPESFYYCGNIELLNEMTGVAIVGSRSISEYAFELAKDAGRIAADNGIAVVNGLATGCDTAALTGSLEKNGKCVAVLAGGINRVYPKVNEGLMQEIMARGGCVISEYAPDEEPKKYTFVQRDRLQSALSRGVLMIAADIGSGTMHTVKSALKQGRRLAAYSSKIVDMSLNRYMLERGAKEIYDASDLEVFYDEIRKEDSIRQMTLYDVI